MERLKAQQNTYIANWTSQHLLQRLNIVVKLYVLQTLRHQLNWQAIIIRFNQLFFNHRFYQTIAIWKYPI